MSYLPIISYGTGGSRPIALGEGDLNNDGHLDLVVGNHSEGTLGILLNQGSGTFSLSGTVDPGIITTNFPSIQQVEVGDLNGDDVLDLVVNTNVDGIKTYLGDADSVTGLGTATYTEQANTLGTSRAVTLGHFNSDNYLDLLLARQLTPGLELWTGDAQGALSYASQVLDKNVSTLAVTQLNGDGQYDQFKHNDQ